MIEKETLGAVLQLKRPEKQNITVYGNYSEKHLDAIYSDNAQSYCIKSIDDKAYNVSNAKSFAAFIKEECGRRENKTGKLSTVVITQQGGSFVADDDFKEGTCKFNRALSQQWHVLAGIVNKTLDHESFLLALQGLKTSIEDFNDLYRKFIKVRIIGKSELDSNPVFIDNEAESGFKVKYTIQGGQKSEDILPSEFKLNLPYSKGSEKKYEVPIEVMMLNNGNNVIAIRIVCPDFERTEELAISDEVTQLRSDLDSLTDLLVLESY